LFFTVAFERTTNGTGDPQMRARSLVLRIWPESRSFEGEPPLWRGSVAELDGSNTRYFDSAAALCRLVADLTGADALRCGEDAS
jgi:hypothetical protein